MRKKNIRTPGSLPTARLQQTISTTALVVAGLVMVAAVLVILPSGNAIELDCDLSAEETSDGGADGGNETNGTGTESESQSGPEPQGGDGGDEPCTPGQIAQCFQLTSDVLDVDGDGLTERVESCFLQTNPFEVDSDGDRINDGIDGVPLGTDVRVPLHLRLATIEQIYSDPSCDVDSTWDLYFDAFGYDIPALNEDVEMYFLEWTKAAHGHEYPYSKFTFQGTGIKESGTGTVTGAQVDFQLDPDLTKWNGGLEAIGLDLVFGPMLVDHDHYDGEGNDDYMPIAGRADILKLGVATWPFDTAVAEDTDTREIGCQGRLTVTTTYESLTGQILATANARESSPGEVVSCSHPKMFNCNVSDATRGWSQAS